MYAFMGSMMVVVVLHASPDPKVWEIVQTATLAVVALLATMIVSLRQQKRLEWSKWRGVEVKNLMFLGLVSGIRTMFLVGMGV